MKEVLLLNGSAKSKTKVTLFIKFSCVAAYCPVPVDEEEEKKAETGLQSRTSKPWQRTPRQVELKVPLRLSSNGKEGIHKFDIPDSGGLQLVLTSRSVLSPNCLPSGTCSIALFLVNSRRPAVDAERDTGYIFQAKLTVSVAESFVPRPNPRGESGDDWDESVADLQYRDEYEYSVGHNVSAVAHLNPDNSCNKVCTAWMPTADVEKVIAAEVQGVELGMEAIASAPDAVTVRNMLGGIVTAYTRWIAEQRTQAPTDSPQRAKVAQTGLTQLSHAIATRQAARGCREVLRV